MADWKSRARDVTNEEPAADDWKTRARPVRTTDEMRAEVLRNALPAPKQSDAALSGLVSGGLKRGFDELSGATYAGGSFVRDVIGGTGLDEASSRLAENYQLGRGTARQQEGEEAAAYPKTSLAMEIGGDVLTDAALAYVTKGRNLTPAGQALTGAVSGLMGSDADWTDSSAKNVGRALVDTGVGGLSRYAGAKAFQKLGQFLQGRVSPKIAERISKAEADELIKQVRAKEKAVSAARGALGGETAAGKRGLDVIAEGLEHATPEQTAAARALLDSEGAQSLQRTVLDNYLESTPKALSRIEAARRGLEEASAIDPGKAASEALQNPIKRHILPRVQTYASRAIPALVAGSVGSQIGGTGGMLAGGALGLGTAAVMGRPGTAIANAMRTPAVRKLGWSLVEDALVNAPQKLGRFAGPLSQSSSAMLMDKYLTDNDAEYAELKRQLLINHAVPEEEGQ